MFKAERGNIFTFWSPFHYPVIVQHSLQLALFKHRIVTLRQNLKIKYASMSVSYLALAMIENACTL